MPLRNVFDRTIALFFVTGVNVCDAQVDPVRSSLDTRSRITLSVVGLDDESVLSDDQTATTEQLGPHATSVSIVSDDGVYVGASNANAVFASTSSGTFTASQSYDGDRAPGDVMAQSFGTTMSGIFEYDFVLSGEGSVRFQGSLMNSGPSFIGFSSFITVFSESTLGGGFTGSFFQEFITDQITSGPTAFDFVVPLTADSGSYRIQVRLNHSGSSTLETDPEAGSMTANWTITAPIACPADFAPVGNPDGVLNFFDVSAFINAYLAMDPAADFEPDGVFNFFDVSAYITAYSAGCP
ncbi:MAG: GC-type dockerin domain-anchored protein [Phycisphaerales bacterium]